MDEKRRDVTVTPPPAEAVAVALVPRISITTHWAKPWLADALNEAKKSQDPQARRREILFAVCFAESYLFEWVRDVVLAGKDLEDLNRYFPLRQRKRRRSLPRKWKEVTKQLVCDGLIPAEPDRSARYWQDFKTKLVPMRHGLVHAMASRPETTGRPEEEKPFPTMRELTAMEAGWPTRVVVELVEQLHKATGTDAPAWLVKPSARRGARTPPSPAIRHLPPGKRALGRVFSSCRRPRPGVGHVSAGKRALGTC